MPITQSVIRVYDDSLKTTLITTVTNSGSELSVDVSSLSPGTEYWATVQVTEDGLTSDESPVYKFYTLPYVEFTGTMHTGSSWFSSLLQHTTTDVGISKWGICWDTSSSFTNPTYKLVKPMPSQEVMIEDLDENTTYYARACVLDIYGRRWVNPNTVTVSTGIQVPSISWYGMAAVGAATYDAAVTVDSDAAITSVVCTYTPDGGSAQTKNLTASTGNQSFHLTNLVPNTRYKVFVTATNAGGSASTSEREFMTTPAEGTVTIECGVGAVDPSTNIISADSKVHYDSSVVTLTGHYIDLYSNPDHEGTPFEEVSGGAVTPISLNLSHADPDETYYVFSHATYTIGGSEEEFIVWSEPVEIMTYSLFKFTNVKPADTWAEARYAVAGIYGGTEIQYSTDGVNWLPVSSGGGDIREGVTIIDLTPDTTYYLRGRCKCAAGWSGWDETTFTTGAEQHEYSVNVVSVSDITASSAKVNMTIDQI